MAVATSECFLIKFFAFCQKHGYLVPDINKQNITGFTYGPLGTELRRNVFNEWWNSEVTISQTPVFPVTVSSSSKKNSSVMSLMNEMMYQHFGSVLHLTGSRLPFGISASETHTLEEIEPAHKIMTKNGFNENGSQHIAYAWKPVEWTGLTLLHFCTPKKPFDWLDHWQKHRLAWWRKFAGTPSHFVLTDISQDDDGSPKLEIQYKFPWGVETIEKLVNMGSTPLNKLKEETGLDVTAKDGRRAVIPHTIAINASLDLAVVMYLSDGYQETKNTDITREVMRLHYRLVPYKVTLAISSSSGNTTKLREHCELVMKQLKKAGITIFPNPDLYSQASLDSQYSRFDAMGIQYSITINDATLKTGTVGLRNRDAITKEQVNITELKNYLIQYLKLQ